MLPDMRVKPMPSLKKNNVNERPVCCNEKKIHCNILGTHIFQIKAYVLRAYLSEVCSEEKNHCNILGVY